MSGLNPVCCFEKIAPIYFSCSISVNPSSKHIKRTMVTGLRHFEFTFIVDIELGGCFGNFLFGKHFLN